ncbi:MAG: threonine/serine dehydratase [Thaumarchaeota archaeon]|nr:threonine/serine dehydratase [Candidatus Calditenuaceae archaeon]MDW8041918.1 threonine/serine dehydratase [Nitrososphaerota archaeon]
MNRSFGYGPQPEPPPLGEVLRAKRDLRKYLNETPLVSSKKLSRLIGADVYVKLENLNPTNSFKVRGGIHFMSAMRGEGLKGVVTASMGNHAQSVAYAGSLFGVPVKVVMPQWVSRLKVEAVEELDAEVIKFGSYYDEAAEYAEKLAGELGYFYVHAIEERLLHVGVATMHLEVVEKLPDVDAVINPLGGGTGAIGAVSVYKAIDPRIEIYGVQAEGADAFYRSFKSGELVNLTGVSTRAEGLAVARTYRIPFELLKNSLKDIVLVSDHEMEEAIRTLYATVRQVSEHAGAAATAAAFKMKSELAEKKVVLMLTGGNISQEEFARVLSGKP